VIPKFHKNPYKDTLLVPKNVLPNLTKLLIDIKESYRDTVPLHIPDWCPSDVDSQNL
jgi:hypothetical protein